MKHIAEVLKDHGQGLEGTPGLWARMEVLKEMIKANEVDQCLEKINQSTNNKILLVCHGGVMMSFSATGIEKSQDGNRWKFVNGKYFQNCEVYPFHYSNM